MSDLEKVVYKILLKEKKEFVREKIVKDLRAGKYRFDFFLPNENIVIEVNGPQHYKYTPFFHKKKSDFKKAQERDRRKIAYCLAKNIKLYIIPYWEIENLSTFKDLTKARFRAKSKFHNDEVWKQQKN